jgi:predicted nucleotidyltransferase
MKVQQAVEILRDLANPRWIILFGSHARGTARPDSDVDLMIVEDSVADALDEFMRLRRALSPLRLPVDLLVVDRQTFEYWRDTPGTVYYDAARSGRTLYADA